MVFSSLQFIFLFLPLVIVGYYLLDKKIKNIFLLLSSLGFYAWGEPKFIFIMILTCMVNYVVGILLYIFRNKKLISKSLVVASLILDLGILFVYKYLNFVTANLNTFVDIRITKIVLPIGISFFTFQMLSYILDVYRNPVKEVCKNPVV